MNQRRIDMQDDPKNEGPCLDDLDLDQDQIDEAAHEFIDNNLETVIAMILKENPDGLQGYIDQKKTEKDEEAEDQEALSRV